MAAELDKSKGVMPADIPHPASSIIRIKGGNMERQYTESELRQKLGDKKDQIVKNIMDRLRKENFFRIHELTYQGDLYLDDELVTSWEPFQRLFSEAIDTVLAAVLSETEKALFEGDKA